MRININDKVKVRLTDVGQIAHHKSHNDLLAEIVSRSRSGPMASLLYQYQQPPEDADGWSTWQLWELMREFGHLMSLGSALPFETEIEIDE